MVSESLSSNFLFRGTVSIPQQDFVVDSEVLLTY